MDKESYVKSAFEEILAKNLDLPVEITNGCKVTDLTLYLKSLKTAYLSSVDPRLDKLFYDKIEQLKQL